MNGKSRERKHIWNLLAAAVVICVMAVGIGRYGRSDGKAADRNPYLERKILQEAGEAGQGLMQAGDRIQEAALKAVGEAAESMSEKAAAAAVPAEEIPIDFEELWKTSPDVYAWIRIPGTQIDYPVCQLQEGDQSFYLNHRPDGTAEFAGSIYSENYNSREFTDPVTVLYGHDMSDGSMFQNLHKYEDLTFFEENREVTIYLPDKVLHYEVFAAYNTNDEHLLLNNGNFEDPGVFYEYFRGVLGGDFYAGFADSGTVLTPLSRVLTLSTCNAYDDQRFLVQCRLTNPEALPR